MTATRTHIDEATREALQAQWDGVVPALIDVKVEPWESTCGSGSGLSVYPVYAVEGIAIDRPAPGGWVVTSRKMADRLTAALRAGVAAPNPRIRVDIFGDTYASYDHVIMGKYMNADLRKLGF